MGAARAFADAGRSVPLQVQAALDVTGRMLLGTDIAAVLAILHAMRVDVIGVNCSVGPEHLREPVRYLCENAPLPVSVIPNAGLPRNVDGVAVLPAGSGRHGPRSWPSSCASSARRSSAAAAAPAPATSPPWSRPSPRRRGPPRQVVFDRRWPAA